MSSSSDLPLEAGSWRSPSWEHATVADVMCAPAVACAPDTPLTAVARTMVTRHIHVVIVAPADGAGAAGWRVVTDRAVAAVGATASGLTAGDVATEPSEAAEPDWPLDRAAVLMADHGASHLVVVDPHGRPTGMLSTIDLAGVIAWGRG